MPYTNVAQYKGFTIALHTYEGEDLKWRSSFKILRADGVVDSMDIDADTWSTEDESREHAIGLAKEMIDGFL